LDRGIAQKLAERKGANIAKSLSGTTQLVVLGTKAGPKKLNDIQKKGIMTTDEEGFYKLVGHVKGEEVPAFGGEDEELDEEDEDEDEEGEE